MTLRSQIALGTLLLAYLAGDLYVFSGPLRQQIDALNPESPRSIAKARQAGVIARVCGEPISRSQLDRATHELLQTEGKSPDALTPDELANARKRALDELIDHELLRAEIARETSPPDLGAHLAKSTSQLTARFRNAEEMTAAAKAQGISTLKSLEDRLAARLVQQKFLESRISQVSTVTEQEALAWYEANQAALANPERVEVRHIFLPALGAPPEEPKQKLDAALAALVAKQKDFPTLARELSQDTATKEQSGTLGWMSRGRIPPDFAEPVFTMPVNQPEIVRTRIGWHLLEVTARKPAEPRKFEDTKADIIAALEARKRQQAIRDLRENLRATRADEVRIFDGVL